MTDRLRDWWNSTRVYDYVPWHRRRERVRPNVRRWPSFNCKLMHGIELLRFWFMCVFFIDFSQFIGSIEGAFVGFLFGNEWPGSPHVTLWCDASQFNAWIHIEFSCAPWAAVQIDCELQSTIRCVQRFHQHHIHSSRWWSTQSRPWHSDRDGIETRFIWFGGCKRMGMCDRWKTRQYFGHSSETSRQRNRRRMEFRYWYTADTGRWRSFLQKSNHFLPAVQSMVSGWWRLHGRFVTLFFVVQLI